MRQSIVQNKSNRRRCSSSTVPCLIQSIEPRLLLATRYVDLNAPGPAHDGSTWNTAYTDLQQALAVSTAGDEIRVADGVYKPTSGTDRTISFQMKSGVSILGGYGGVGAADPDARDIEGTPTVLSGDVGVTGDANDNSIHVVIAINTDVTTVLNGCAVTGGRAHGGTTSQLDGAGMYIVGGGPTISHCAFVSNSADNNGGAMLIQDASPKVTDCQFVSNFAGYGAGVYSDLSSAPFFGNCVFSLNIGWVGGGGISNRSGSTTLMVDCLFQENFGQQGGGIQNELGSVNLFGCTFLRNTAFNGAGIANSAGDSSTTSIAVTRCTFEGNEASAVSAISIFFGVGHIVDSRFVGNRSGSVGGAISNSFNAEGGSSIRNSTFVANISTQVTGGIFFGLPIATDNCIVWGNSPTQVVSVFADVGNVRFSNIQGGWAGEGNIDADPLFVRNPDPGPDLTWGTADDDYGDLRLQAGSPCLDAGSNAAVAEGSTVDLDGNDRFSDILGVNDPGAIVDMGAYERVGVYGVIKSPLDPDGSSPAAKLTFSTEMLENSVGDADLIVNAVNPDGSLGTPVGVIGHSFDASTNTIRFFLPVSMADGNYRARLVAGSVSDASSDPLAADYTFDFHILAGDANRDRKVDLHDLMVLANNWMGTGKTFSQGDFNYDSIVNAMDLGILATRWQQRVDLPAPTPPLPTAPRPASRTATRTPTRVSAEILR